MRIVGRFLGTLALTCAMAAPAAAQQPAAPGATSAGGGGIAGDYAITYGYTRTDTRGVKTTYDKGFQFSAAYRFASNVLLVGEIGGAYTKTAAINNVYSYSGGIRFQTHNRQTLRPFVIIQFGAANDGAKVINHFSILEYGGGVDIGLGAHFAVRAEVTDPLFLFFGPVEKGVRGEFGIVIPIGK